MKRLMTAVFVATLALVSAYDATARKTYTFEELESMKKAGGLKGNERFIIIESEGSVGLTGRKADESGLSPLGVKTDRHGNSDAIAYDKVTTTRYLSTMAREYYGNFEFWPYIYEENKEKLGDPDRTTPGTMVVVPDLKKYSVNPKNPADVEKARRLGSEIYARYGKQY